MNSIQKSLSSITFFSDAEDAIGSTKDFAAASQTVVRHLVGGSRRGLQGPWIGIANPLQLNADLFRRRIDNCPKEAEAGHFKANDSLALRHSVQCELSVAVREGFQPLSRITA